jgi:hypothetical protein
MQSHVDLRIHLVDVLPARTAAPGERDGDIVLGHLPRWVCALPWLRHWQGVRDAGPGDASQRLDVFWAFIIQWRFIEIFVVLVL